MNRLFMQRVSKPILVSKLQCLKYHCLSCPGKNTNLESCWGTNLIFQVYKISWKLFKTGSKEWRSSICLSVEPKTVRFGHCNQASIEIVLITKFEYKKAVVLKKNDLMWFSWVIILVFIVICFWGVGGNRLNSWK